MKKDFDIESLFKNIQLIKLDPAKEEACQERLKSYFAKLEAQESWKEKPVKTVSKPWFAYATACVVLLCAASISIFLFNAQASKVRNLVKVIVEKENKTMYISSIDVNLLTRKAIVYTPFKKLIINLNTHRIEREVSPVPVVLSKEEKKLAIEILHQKRIPYDIITENTNKNNSTIQDDSSGVYFFPEPITVIPSNSESELEDSGKNIVKFYTTDPIVRIDGFKYPDTLTKMAYIEVQSDATKGFQIIFVVDLEKKVVFFPSFTILEH